MVLQFYSKSSQRTVALSMCPSQTYCIHNVIGKLKPEQQEKLKKHSIYSRDLRRTLGQNHKKHSIALLVPFVSKKGTNRGIKCQFDILEKNPKGGPFYVKKIFISISAQISCVSFQGQKHSISTI